MGPNIDIVTDLQRMVREDPTMEPRGRVKYNAWCQMHISASGNGYLGLRLRRGTSRRKRANEISAKDDIRRNERLSSQDDVRRAMNLGTARNLVSSFLGRVNLSVVICKMSHALFRSTLLSSWEPF